MQIYFIFFGDTGGFMRKLRPEEATAPEKFYARFNEEWKVMEKKKLCRAKRV